MQRRIIPGVIDGKQELCCIAPDATVAEAAKLMRARHVAAVLVTEGQRLAGIVTERDVTYRVTAEDRDPHEVRVREVMTDDPKTIAPDDTAGEALQLMRAGHFRHLPVVENGRVVGMVSLRDLYEAVRASLEEDLQNAASFIQGETYGTSG